MYFDTSADGISWSNLHSFANPFALTSVKVGLAVGTAQAEGSTTNAIFDNFNILPSGTTYTYDANGNMTSDGTTCYQINQANQIDKVTKCSTGQTIAEYVYDYNGNRMVKRNFTNGTLANTVTSWSDSFETKAIVGGATENTSYYFANGQLIAKKDNSGTSTYFHNDHLGSTSLVTNSSGSLVENTTYDPWGEVKLGGTSSKFLYTGQEHDSESGLHYYNARYYNSNIRRFTQPDDIIQDVYNPQGLNRYSYVWNNPLKYTDPTGHINEILKYNQALNDYYKKRSATSYNNVLNTASSIQKQSKSTSQPAPSQNNRGGGGSRSNNVSAPSRSASSPSGGNTSGGGSSSPTSLQTNLVKGASISRNNIGIVGGCLSGSAGLGVYGTTSGCVHYSFAEKKWGVTGTLGGGGTTGVTVGGGVSVQVSNAQKFSDMLGQDVFTGGSAGGFWQGNVDVSWNVDNTNIKTVDIGGGVGGSFSLPVYPLEFHGGSTYTWGKSF